MNANSVVIHTAALSKTGINQPVREGSSVSVRILEQTGRNTYTASFAGGRFSVTSQRALEPGTVFTAIVRIENGRIALVPQNAASEAGAVVYNFNGSVDASGMISDPVLASYFTQLGLIPDAVSLALFQEMKQLGMRFDLQLMNKARAAASKFPGREEEAAQAALVLEKKGLAADEHAVMQILGCGYEESGGENSSRNNEGREQGSERSSENMVPDGNSPEAVFKSFFENIFSGGKISSSADVLTLFNHSGFDLNPDGNGGNWIRVPFEFSYLKSKAERNGKGSVSFFISKDAEQSKKFIVNFDFFVTNYFFVLYFKHNKCSKVRFSVYPAIAEEECRCIMDKLKALFTSRFHGENVPVLEPVCPGTISGFCSELDSVAVAKGSI